MLASRGKIFASALRGRHGRFAVPVPAACFPFRGIA